jgi:predicted lipid-binding transport protein (Tim44 family)
MWSLIRSFVVVLALAGFIGQTSARAMPMPMTQVTDAAATAAQSAPAQPTSTMTNCAEMPGMAKAPAAKSPTPCTGMTADCIGKMGCATVATTPPAAFGVSGSVAYKSVTFANLDQMREGVGAPGLYHPPRPLA